MKYIRLKNGILCIELTYELLQVRRAWETGLMENEEEGTSAKITEGEYANIEQPKISKTKEVQC